MSYREGVREGTILGLSTGVFLAILLAVLFACGGAFLFFRPWVVSVERDQNLASQGNFSVQLKNINDNITDIRKNETKILENQGDPSKSALVQSWKDQNGAALREVWTAVDLVLQGENVGRSTPLQSYKESGKIPSDVKDFLDAHPRP